MGDSTCGGDRVRLPDGGDVTRIDEPNYTQVPNFFLDSLLPEIKTASELKVTLAIMRATFGWHKDEDALSITQLMERTGLGRQSVVDGLRVALDRGFVQRRKDGSAFLYSLSVQKADSPKSGTNNSPESGPSGQLPGIETGPESGPTKERTASKEKGKEIGEAALKLCEWLEREADTEPRPKYSDTMLAAAQHMLGLAPKEEIIGAVRWAHENNPYYASKVLTAGELKRAWPKLRASWKAAQRAGSRRNRRSKADSIDSKVETMRKAARS